MRLTNVYTRVVAEREDFRDQVAEGDLGRISIGRLYDFAASDPSYLKTIPLSKVEHELSWWEGDVDHMMTVNTNYPILVVVSKDGSWTVPDGLNRIKKAISVEKKKSIKAYVIPIDQIPSEVFL
jgi:hypothetical protein